MPTLPTVIVPGQPGHISHHETLHAWHNRTVDAADFDIVSWESTLGLDATNGSPFITNSVTPFDADDIGKKVIINRIAGGATKFYAEIVDVSGGVAEMDVNADFTVVGQRVQWGFDQTSLIAAAFTELAAATGDRKILQFRKGMFRATRIVVPTTVGWVGEGWGNPSVGSSISSWIGQSATFFKQLPGLNDDFVRFAMAFATSSSLGYCLYDRIQDFVLEGPETNITAYPYTGGGGMIMQTDDGTHDLMPQDQCFMERVAANFFYDDGFAGPMGPVPNAYQNLRGFYNGGYGMNFDGGNPQAVHLLNFSCDGNGLGGIRIANVQDWSTILITTYKSEKAAVELNPRGGSTNYQDNAVVLEHVKGMVLVNGIQHISALHDPPEDTGGTVYAAPGAAIKIIATDAADVPQLHWLGVGVRDHHDANPATTETGGPGPTVEDSTNGFTSFDRFGDYGISAGDPLTPSIASLTATSGSPAVGLVGGGRRQSLLFDSGATEEAAAGKVFIPDGWSSIDVTVEWANAGAGSGGVVWLFQGDQFADGDTTNVADTYERDGTETAGAQDVFKSTPLTGGGTFPVTGGQHLFFRIKRVTNNANDTLGNDAALLGIQIIRVS